MVYNNMYWIPIWIYNISQSFKCGSEMVQISSTDNSNLYNAPNSLYREC